ncbi:hypothetical protein HWV62_43405 [Athelia sp. TMB]|nr:hypothetical protein HWV62_43405 [Athelia sp. TMB]
MDSSNSVLCSDNFAPFQQPQPPQAIFSPKFGEWSKNPEPCSGGLFDAQDMHPFYQRDAATEIEGHNGLADASMLQPPDSIPSYELYGSASNEQGGLFDEVGIALEGATQEEVSLIN